MAGLVLEHVSKTYRNGFTALEDVTLELSTGVFALLGPNGAGKSTLMQIVAGLLKPTSGVVSIKGLTPADDLEAYRTSVGYLPQHFGFPAGSTVGFVLDHLGRLRGLDDRDLRRERIESVLSSVNLLSRINSRVATLSGGMRQRLGIAQALLHDPAVLALDEPTVGLDPEERSSFLLLLSEYAADRTVILSTHLIDDVEAICQEMGFISRGQLLSSGNRKQVLSPLRGTILSLPPSELRGGRKLYDTLESGRRVMRVYFEEGVPGHESPAKPAIRDAYALSIPRGDC